MAEHTPTPWRIDGHSCRPRNDKPKGSRLVSDRGDGFTFHIAAVGAHPGINAEQARANAAFIVQAVNNHKRLVEALEVTQKMIAGEIIEAAVIDTQTMEGLGSMIGRVLADLNAPRHT